MNGRVCRRFKYNGNKGQARYGQRQQGMEEDFIGSQCSQRTVELGKKKKKEEEEAKTEEEENRIRIRRRQKKKKKKKTKTEEEEDEE